MFEKVVNEWEEITYVPTPLGYALLGMVIILLVLVAVFAAKKTGKKRSEPGPENNALSEETGGRDKRKPARSNAKRLVFCAMSIALGTVLSNVKLFHFPTGGSITLLSMLVICLPGYFYGIGAGLLTGVAYGILQLIVDPYVLYPLQLVMDYILGFGALGLSGLFSSWKKNGLTLGYIVAVLGRYFFVVLSGFLFFASYAWEGWNPLLYSFVYNGIYIFSEAIVTIAVLQIPPVQKAMAMIKKFAEE